VLVRGSNNYVSGKINQESAGVAVLMRKNTNGYSYLPAKNITFLLLCHIKYTNRPSSQIKPVWGFTTRTPK